MNKIKLLIFAILIVISVSFVLMSGDEVSIGITALDAKIIADDIAYNWSQNATLISISTPPLEKMIDNGTYSHWRFRYIADAIILEFDSVGGTSYMGTDYNTQSLFVLVYSDERYESDTETHQYYWQVVSDFLIDSDQAYQIAMSNNTVIDFLKNETVIGPHYQMHNNSGNLIWGIIWVYTIDSDPGHIFWVDVSIDAMTGELQAVILEKFD